MTTYYDALNNFFKSLGSERLASSAQLIYVHLLHLNNRSGNRGVVQVTDRELNELTQLSRPTVTKAKQILKNRGLIDFKTDNRNPHAGTVYNLQIFSQSVSQSVSQSGDVPNIRVREDLKDFKTEDLLSTSAATRACAPVNYDIDRLVERWEQSEAFGKIDMLIVAKLTALLESYTCDEILAAMDKAILGNGNKRGINYNYFEAILKGGDRNVRVDRHSRRTRTDAVSADKGRFDDDEPDYNAVREKIRRLQAGNGRAQLTATVDARS